MADDRKTATERALDQNTEKLAKLEEKIIPLIDVQRAEIDRLGQVTTDTANKLAGLSGEFTETKETQTRLEDALAEIETRSATGETDGHKTATRLALGLELWKHPEVKEFRARARGGRKGEGVIEGIPLWTPREIRSRASHPALRMPVTMAEVEREIRALSVELDETSIGAAVHTFFAGIFEAASWTPVLRQLCMQQTTTMTDSVQDDRETDSAVLAGVVDVAQTSGNNTLVVEEIEGFSNASPFNVVRIKRVAGATLTMTIQTVTESTRTLTFTGNLTADVAKGDLVLAIGGLQTDEGALVPLSYDEITAKTFPLVKFGGAKKVTVEKLADIARFAAWIERRLLRNVGQQEALNFYYGPGGSATRMTGLFADTDITQLTLDTANLEPLLDLFVRSFYDIVDSDYVPTDTIVSTAIHQRLTKLKMTTGDYLLWNAMSGGGPGERVHMTRLHMDRALVATHAVMGAFGEAITLHDSQQAVIEVGTEDKDLRKRKRTVVATERVAMAVNYPSAIRWLIAPTS